MQMNIKFNYARGFLVGMDQDDVALNAAGKD